ncbi:MAG: hypothetical protein F6K63_34495 [Moorea sp. SIO1G6]|uniref:hypothetical protein n=1 Tax=Moorena sp. SIO1G6 TaxID=2607840 RepID=UPI0013C13AC1|nr:hypothetical protein [Moorena sp. SIO1G6]NET69233.1 hypothetical protein [Moorena sp. SIO1G6]
MPIPRQDASSTARCQFHGKMPIPQVRPVANLILNRSSAPKQHAYCTDATRRTGKMPIPPHS